MIYWKYHTKVTFVWRAFDMRATTTTCCWHVVSVLRHIILSFLYGNLVAQCRRIHLHRRSMSIETSKDARKSPMYWCMRERRSNFFFNSSIPQYKGVIWRGWTWCAITILGILNGIDRSTKIIPMHRNNTRVCFLTEVVWSFVFMVYCWLSKICGEFRNVIKWYYNEIVIGRQACYQDFFFWGVSLCSLSPIHQKNKVIWFFYEKLKFRGNIDSKEPPGYVSVGRGTRVSKIRALSKSILTPTLPTFLRHLKFLYYKCIMLYWSSLAKDDVIEQTKKLL